MSIVFNVKRPGKGKRATFAIVRVERRPGRKPEGKTLKLEEVETLNRNLRSGLITLKEANQLIDSTVLPEVKRRAGLSEKLSEEARVTEVNWKLFEEFWEQEYSLRSRNRASTFVTARYEFVRALEIVKPLSLASVPRATLQRHWDAAIKGNLSRKYGSCINQLLKFLGRDYTLHLPKRERFEIKYITEDELPVLLAHIRSEPAALLAQVLFATGARIGEAFMFTERALKRDRSIYIDKQLLRRGEVGRLKNDKPHKTLLLPGYEEAYRAWCQVPQRRSLRSSLESHIRRAAARAFPGDPERQVSAHGLRHSYAIHLLGLGLGLSDIASLLGDDDQTVRDYYTGFVASDEQIDRICRLLDKRASNR